METTRLNVPNAYKYFKQWSVFNIICESDLSKIFTCFPIISYLQLSEFVTECLKTDTREVSDEQAIERALTAIQQPGVTHVSFTVSNIQFHVYHTTMLEPVFV